MRIVTHGLALIVWWTASVSQSEALELIGSDQDKGAIIANEIERRDAGFKDYLVSAKMILKQDEQVLSTREFRQKVLEIEGDGDHSVNIFHTPRDVAGLAVLVHSHGLVPDDQWVYLPALRRVKRISTRNKSGPFAGSEFAYEDIADWLPEKYSRRFIAEEKIDNTVCYRLEEIPLYAQSGYSKLVQWVDAKIFRPIKIEYYDRKGELLKTLEISDYKEYNGGFWRPGRMLMQSHQTGRSTELLWEDYEFETGLTSSDISKSKLSRLR